ncbi:MAG: hypothetical protein ACE367_15105 [Acidimicrobiales bacterium]
MSRTTLIAILLIGLGTAMAALGSAARNGRIDLPLGGHTRDTTSADSWRRAHERIGTWLSASGWFAVAAGIVAAVAADISVWAAVAGFAALVILPLVGTALGVRELRAARPVL